ncbi:MAG: hypothetical protein HOC71_07485 [Candidatus Latescibacteria bacterium]|jgi:hypothetical protein|nr:hypothetical protein [Candidatus Latescibacterota bacterium]
MAELKISVAYDKERNIVRPENAVTGVNYHCPACGELLIFRRGQIKVPHFAHKQTEACNQETIVHQSAKLLIQKAIEDWKVGKSEPPVLERKCRVCDRNVEQNLPEKVDYASLEHRLPEGFIVDIGLIAHGNVEAAIEVRVTHEVDEAKAQQISIPFIEVDGNEILENPSRWKPTIDFFKPLTCTKCRLDFQNFRKKTLRIAKQTGVDLPTSFYRYASILCWQCNKEILVFTWPNHKMYSQELPIGQPPPKTLCFRFSKAVGRKYCMNTCIFCNAIQGDRFLHIEPEGPFLGLCYDEDTCGKDSLESFQEDLIKLASYADYIGDLERED